MVTDELRKYVAENLDLGHNPNDIAQGLIDQGWSEIDVNRVFDEFFPPEPEEPPPLFAFDVKDRSFPLLIFVGFVVAVASVVFGVYVIFSGPNDKSETTDNENNVEDISKYEVTASDLPSIQPADQVSMEEQDDKVDELPTDALDDSPEFSVESENETGIVAEETSSDSGRNEPSTDEEKLLFAKNFASCEPTQILETIDYNSETHTIVTEIVGWREGKCHYRRDVSWRGETQCTFAEEDLKNISKQLLETITYKGKITRISDSEEMSTVETRTYSNGEEYLLLYLPNSNYYTLDGGSRKIDYIQNLREEPDVCVLPPY